MAVNVWKALRRKPDTNRTLDNGAAAGATLPIRLSGTVPYTPTSYERSPKDAGLANDNPNGRTGNDWLYPDNPRGRFDVDQVNGDRLQNFANSHLSEGEAPGRIPRGWNNRIQGKVDGVEGSIYGIQHAGITVTGNADGGIMEMMYVPHTPTPRNIGIARAFLRTVDDGAPIPGIFLSDPSRH